GVASPRSRRGVPRGAGHRATTSARAGKDHSCLTAESRFPMTADPQIIRHTDADELAEAVAVALITRIVEYQRTQSTVSVALTGGGMGTAVLRAVAASTSSPDTQPPIDWAHVDLWWGDERFLPPGDPERNETQAREALIDRLPIPPERVHPVHADTGSVAGDPDAAAALYAAEFEDAGGRLDIVLLGVGPDGHVASLFPGHTSQHSDRVAVAVHASHKPTPMRVSLTMSTIRSAREVWLVVAGADKADAVTSALTGTGSDPLPAAEAEGTDATLWWVDQKAASGL